MEHLRWNRTMQKVAAAFVLVLLVLRTPGFSSAGLVVVENSPSVTPKRGLPNSIQPITVAVDMMNVHHVDLQYMQPNHTLLERAQNSAQRSKQQLRYISSRISGRRKTLASEDHFTSPVFSQQGDYVFQISVGTPARTVLAFLDTGSDITWLQCTSCLECYKQPVPLFDPKASSTYVPMNCSAPLCVDLSMISSAAGCSTTGNDTCLYKHESGDGTVAAGRMAYETFTFTTSDGSQVAVPGIGFGCGTDQAPKPGPYDFEGLVGLGGGPVSLVSQLGSSIEPVFSYCLVSFASANTTTSPLLLGSVGNKPLQYTPLIKNSFHPSYYYVNLVGITVDNSPVNYPADTFSIDPTTGTGGFILDTGTPFTELFDAAYTPFKDAIAALVSYPERTVEGFDLCYDTSSVIAPVFPTVVFQLECVNLTMPSNNVFLEVDTEGTYCMWIANQGTIAEEGVSTFGNVQQQNFQIAYDRPNTQVGFAATTC